MRTTVTLDPDTEQMIRRRMRERGMSFSEALNDAIRQGSSDGSEPFRTSTASLGRSAMPLDRALQMGAELEDAELSRRMRATACPTRPGSRP